MDEYVLVVFEEDGRQVLADGGVAGLTNRLFVPPPGPTPFRLPASKIVLRAL
jgi:hypothetical protein